jgi:hypothetical protein
LKISACQLRDAFHQDSLIALGDLPPGLRLTTTALLFRFKGHEVLASQFATIYCHAAFSGSALLLSNDDRFSKRLAAWQAGFYH